MLCRQYIADRMYLALLLVFVNKLEQASSVLNAIIEAEGEYSQSVVISQKAFYE